MSKMPLGKFPLWLYSLSFSTSFFFFFLSPCQVVRMTLILETRVFFSFPDSDRGPTCHPETIPQKPINSFKSKISPCAPSTGPGSVPSTKDRCNSKEKCKCTYLSTGLKNLKQFVFTDRTRRSPFPTLAVLRQPLQTNFHIKPKTANRALCVIQNSSCTSELWPNDFQLIRIAFQIKRRWFRFREALWLQANGASCRDIVPFNLPFS